MIFKLSSGKGFCSFVPCLKVLFCLVSSKTWGERVGGRELREFGNLVKLNFCILSCWSLSARGTLRKKRVQPKKWLPKATENTPSCMFILIKGKRVQFPGAWASGLMTTDIHKVKSFPLIVTFAQHASSEAKLFSNVHGPVVPFGLTEPIIETRFGQSSQSQPSGEYALFQTPSIL